MVAQQTAGGPPAAARVGVLDVQVDRLDELFNAIDPAPFRGRALDPDAEAYLVARAHQDGRRRRLQLRVYLAGEPVTEAAATGLRQAVHIHFHNRAVATRRQIRRLLRNGRISLAIGLVFLGVATLVESAITGIAGLPSYVRVLADSLIIGGWVALWRPLEIFLYDWWPLLGQARLYDRMSIMTVELRGAPHPATDPSAPR